MSNKLLHIHVCFWMGWTRNYPACTSSLKRKWFGQGSVIWWKESCETKHLFLSWWNTRWFCCSVNPYCDWLVIKHCWVYSKVTGNQCNLLMTQSFAVITACRSKQKQPILLCLYSELISMPSWTHSATPRLRDQKKLFASILFQSVCSWLCAIVFLICIGGHKQKAHSC